MTTGDDAAPCWFAQHAIPMAVLLAFLGYFVYKQVDLTVVGLVALGLGLVIFVHELGHFLAAKWCDVYVETFSIGFGPSLPYCEHKWGETTYKLGLIPLGGYVKMLGEGSESEEGEDDPRSFKNKGVGQRMLIISAGVIMNILFAAAGFIGIYMGPGIDRVSGVIGQIDPGSPAWQAGLRSGSVIESVGSLQRPYFDQIKTTIALSGRGEQIPVSFQMPNGKLADTVLEPRFAQDPGQKFIGFQPARSTVVWASPRLKVPAYWPGTAASLVAPALQNEDRIVATTDPARPDGPLLPLPSDPRSEELQAKDFFELHKRLTDLAGQPIQIQVERKDPNQPNATPKLMTATVPPAFARDLGLVMRMGSVAAVRHKSPAESGGVKPSSSGDEGGDRIERVEVTNADGTVTRFSNVRLPQTAVGVVERPLDPVRLPFELERWADKTPGPKSVKFGLLRQDGHAERTKVEVTLPWDDSWRYAREVPLSAESPVSIPGLGLAYYVESVVEDVIKGSVADQAGIKPASIVDKVRLYDDADLKESTRIDLRKYGWAYVLNAYNTLSNANKIDLFVKTGAKGETKEISLEPPEDKTWPLSERGFRFTQDSRHQHADTPWQAVVMGKQRVVDTAKNVYVSLLRMVEGGISFWKNANGPLAIAVTSYNVAGESATHFLLLLCVLSVNLAVLNFLPIPVLDGGHMVFLLYEKFRGRPAPEVVRTAATFAGMALLLSLMACVLVLDVMKYFFKS